jgi:hypothetical protein
MNGYRAWVRRYDGTETEWTGLRKTQAIWRYHWLNRNYRTEFKSWGWEKAA